MRRRPLSIRARFLLVSLAVVPAALALAGLVLISLFADNLERRIQAELSNAVANLAGAVAFSPDGEIQRPADGFDPRFSEALGGLYWQIEDEGTGRVLRSQSLWDVTLALPADLDPGESQFRYELAGPSGTRLLAFERHVMVSSPTGARTLRIVAAADRAPLDEASRIFALDIVPFLVALALFLVAASLAQLVIGLRPLSQLTAGLDRIRERQGGMPGGRLEGVLPKEFAPVEAALNRLLDAQGRALSEARARAGDLAHGLKTPLTVLSNDALTLKERGEREIGEEVEVLVAAMRVHVERELARSRIAANAGLRQEDADLTATLEPLVRTLKRTPDGERLDWTLGLPAGRRLPIDPQDLRELAGNLLENAAKWAAAGVRLGWDEGTGGAGTLVVEDDGPGVDPARIRAMTTRGVRLDETTPGTGLGLSIVREIADIYGLDLTIGNRQERGLRVAVAFPADAAAPRGA